eukprot:2123584-Heterocapsa_arctica.AAC.1
MRGGVCASMKGEEKGRQQVRRKGETQPGNAAQEGRRLERREGTGRREKRTQAVREAGRHEELTNNLNTAV